MDCRILNMHLCCCFLHTYTHREPWFTVSPKGLLLWYTSAQNLTLKKSWGKHKAQHITVTHPHGGHAQSHLTYGMHLLSLHSVISFLFICHSIKTQPFILHLSMVISHCVIQSENWKELITDHIIKTRLWLKKTTKINLQTHSTKINLQFQSTTINLQSQSTTINLQFQSTKINLQFHSTKVNLQLLLHSVILS